MVDQVKYMVDHMHDWADSTPLLSHILIFLYKSFILTLHCMKWRIWKLGNFFISAQWAAKLFWNSDQSSVEIAATYF